jgi:hypothetical protein
MQSAQSNYRSAYGNRREPRKNHGVPGAIYILGNPGLKDGYYKIGSTRRSGWSKAMELNRDLNNAIPGAFECVFELHTRDSGRALDMIDKELEYCRRGRKDQDYFELDLERAKQAIVSACQEVDRQVLSSYRSKLFEARQQQEQASAPELPGSAASYYSMAEQQASLGAVPSGVLRRAYLWMSAAVSLSLLVALVWILSTWTSPHGLQAATGGNAARAIQSGFSGQPVAEEAAQALPAQPSLPLPRSAQKLAERLAALSEDQRTALGMACLDGEKNAEAFSDCLLKQLSALEASQAAQLRKQQPDLPTLMSSLNEDEKQALGYACMEDKLKNGLPAYQACLQRQLAGFSSSLRPAGWSQLAQAEQKTIQAACTQDKYNAGPAAYDRCLSRRAAERG